MNVCNIEYTIKESIHESFIPGRCAEVLVAGKKVGLFGELHPQVLENWGIEMPIVALELDFEIFC